MISKKETLALTNCPANRGMYSIIARRTRHFESSASSMIAGSNDCESSCIPMTEIEKVHRMVR